MNRLPELLSNTISTFSLPVSIAIIILGLISILAGHKLYWLAAGLNAFLATYIAVSTVMNWTAWQDLLTAVVAGLAVGFFTILLQRISFSINGFFVFGLLIAILFTQVVSFESDSFIPIIVFFIAGSLAAFFNLTRPSASLIYTTAFIGAFAIVCGLFRLLPQVPSAWYMIIVWGILGIGGSIFQMRYIEGGKKENN